MLVKKRKQMSDGDCDCDPLYNLNEVEMGRRGELKKKGHRQNRLIDDWTRVVRK